jgi:hypothetical protein
MAAPRCTSAHQVLTDETYRQQLLVRMRSLEPPPHLETLLFFYAFGRPAQQIAVSAAFDHAGFLRASPPGEDAE